MSDLHGYDNKGVIKSGTFGTVFKVVRKADGVAFAMKVQRCTSEAESLLCKREVQHMQKLSHAGLVPCLEHFERQTEYQEPAHHIIMPLYTGDLEEYITENGPLTEEIMGRLLWDVGSALHYLHQEGCLHRDVKPQNIMRDAQLDRFVLGDLGLMKDTTHSIASSLVGTPGFLAPEFLAQSHNAAYDSKVDMWALGVTACYAGLRPYEQDKLFRYLHLNYEFIMKELRPLLQDRIGHTLQHPVLCMMRKEAAHRMSAGELLHHVGARLRDSVAGLTKEREAARVALNAAEEKIRQLEGIKLLEKEARASSPPLVGTSEKQQNQLEDSVSQISGTPPPSHVEPSAAPLENLSPVEEQGSYKDGWEVLSTLGMDVEKHKNGYKAAPLSVAVENDHEEAIRQLCSNQTIDINAPGLGGYTVLHTAVQKGSKSIVDILLSFKADPDKVTDFGWTALHLAAQRGMFQVVDVLLRSKANPNKRDKYGETPLHVASKHGSVPVVDRLMDSSADPNLQNNPNGWTPLHHAAYEGHASIAEAMRWCKAASMKDNHVTNNMGWEWRAFTASAPVAEVGHVERRTDVYRVGVGPGYGLKMRGGGGLELKTLVKERGEQQKWTKRKVDDDTLCSHIPGYAAMRIANIRVAKRRFYTRLPSVGQVEVVNITLDPAPPGQPASWVSYCVEDGDLTKGAQAVKASCLQEGSIVGGYPSWLDRLYS